MPGRRRPAPCSWSRQPDDCGAWRAVRRLAGLDISPLLLRGFFRCAAVEGACDCRFVIEFCRDADDGVCGCARSQLEGCRELAMHERAGGGAGHHDPVPDLACKADMDVSALWPADVDRQHATLQCLSLIHIS